MMSLFSSFDLYFFSSSWISFIFIFSSLFLSQFLVSSWGSVVEAMYLSLGSFFFSLKSKSFNKMSFLLFISMFFLLVCLNFFSVFSYNFPYSSQISVMMVFTFGLWSSMVAFSFFMSTKKFLSHLVPEGTPLPLTFLLFLIELISNLIRPITLMVRLVANILAGHLLMILLSNLVFKFSLAFFAYVFLNMMEIFVSLIQSYIFSTMLVLYYSEV